MGAQGATRPTELRMQGDGGSKASLHASGFAGV